MHVALLGGSFNPPHVGHLLAAGYVHATQAVDEVWLMPVFTHVFGKELWAFHHRLAMCEVLCAETSGWLKTNPVEKELGGTGRTVEVLEHLTQRHAGVRFSLIVGSDTVKDFPRWYNLPRIQELAQVLVVNRAGHPAAEGLGPPLAEVSSTEVRRRLQAGESVRELLPRGIIEYAHAHALFRSP